jgi:hypothetical protein
MYTPPAGNAVAFNFTASYTPPLGTAVAYDFGALDAAWRFFLLFW